MGLMRAACNASRTAPIFVAAHVGRPYGADRACIRLARATHTDLLAEAAQVPACGTLGEGMIPRRCEAQRARTATSHQGPFSPICARA